MSQPLAVPSDVEDMWRPLSGSEMSRVANLITKASSMLRQRAPWLDARMARFKVDPTDLGGLDPVTVATVVATIVKRFLVNPDGATNTSETTGPYSYSRGFALRGDRDVRGELSVTDSDVAALAPAQLSPSRIGTIKSHARLAPWPYGSVGSPTIGTGSSMDLWLLENQGGVGELPYLPSHDSSS